MNAKSLFIAAAVLATPACAVTEDEISAASDEAIAARVTLLGETYLSRDVFTIEEYRRRPDGEYVKDRIAVRYRLRFIPAGTKTTEEVWGDYTYEGESVMEYETVIDAVHVEKPALAYSRDVAYYAKRTDGDSFRLFDCDSTHRCADGDRVSKVSVFTEGGRKVVKLAGLDVGDGRPGIFLDGVNAREVLFDPTTPAPEHAALPHAVSCAAGGRTLDITPAAAPSTTGASFSLKSADGTVLEEDRWIAVKKDSLGHTFVVAPWSGLVISLGDRAARFENEVTGLVVDFPQGSCTILE